MSAGGHGSAARRGGAVTPIKKSVVAVRRCPGYDEHAVAAAVKGAVELAGGMDGVARKGERIIIKPNILAGRPVEAAVTTHPAVVKAVIRMVREAGATAVVGDSPGLGGARAAAAKCGILKACEEAGAEFAEFKEPVEVEAPPGALFRRFEIAREVMEADGVINLPKLKTHAQVLLTMGVKNVFGCVPGKRKAQWHLAAGADPLSFGAMLLDLHGLIRPRLTIMDAVVAMEGNGPGSGDPREVGLVFASRDAVAMDLAAASIVGADPEQMPVLKAARARALPGSRMADVDVVGDGAGSRVEGFRFPPMMHVNFAYKLPDFLDRGIRKALTSRPSVDQSKCTLCNVCVESCPPGVMKNTKKVTIDYDGCIRCYCCQELCPHGAIEPRSGWLKKLIPGL